MFGHVTQCITTRDIYMDSTRESLPISIKSEDNVAPITTSNNKIGRSIGGWLYLKIEGICWSVGCCREKQNWWGSHFDDLGGFGVEFEVDVVNLTNS